MNKAKFRKIARFGKRAHEHYKNDILLPLERTKKAIMGHQKLSKEKIEEVQQLIADGVKKADIIEQTGVSASTVDRVKAGRLTADNTAKKAAKKTPKTDNVGRLHEQVRAIAPAAPLPAQTFTALEAAPDVPTQRELEALKALIGQAVRAFAGIECATAADSYNLGQTYGLLTAAQMILEGEA
jgi:hypothetical protein